MTHVTMVASTATARVTRVITWQARVRRRGVETHSTGVKAVAILDEKFGVGTYCTVGRVVLFTLLTLWTAFNLKCEETILLFIHFFFLILILEVKVRASKCFDANGIFPLYSICVAL